MPKPGQVLQPGYILEVPGQLEELLVCVPVRVGVPKRPDLQPVLGVHEEVAPQVVEHDGVAGGVVGVLRPDNTQGLNLGAGEGGGRVV